MKNKVIAIDVISQEKPVEEPLAALLKFKKANSDIDFIIVGDKDKIVSILKEDASLFRIEHTTKPVDPNIGVLELRRDTVSGLAKSIKLVQDGEADAIISPAPSGPVVTSTFLSFRTIDPELKPGFMPHYLNSQVGETVHIDVGANIANTPLEMLNFAKMAKVYLNALGFENPNVGLLNIGTEDKKGTALYQETFDLLKNDPEVNFYGNVESNTMLKSPVNIIVSDGFTGNIALKAMEGSASVISTLLSKTFKSNIWTKLCTVMMYPWVSKLKSTMDYRKKGTAVVLGLTELVIKTHSSADRVAFESAIELTAKLVRQDMIQKLKDNYKK